ncbi:uncharacterized protein K452DRAFT_276428 [Aplosporella prunicola CBS 121167]|uniref:Chromosome condensation protein n=1 Tax=Aplosporella prunicola CBS 121167 TaxID=1176127 RepID=A0A6A6B6W4_9PEZI|nr:uncharacterized protein K452DRAFT_276428 [Aplosporella prunicola CBS 121167]KAF2138727.1 hypothetical protein K452DRAFT_276428 [Aplosporella prunicola CBS 121167]
MSRDEYTIPNDYRYLDDNVASLPVDHYQQKSIEDERRRPNRAAHDAYSTPANYGNLDEVTAPSPVDLRPHNSLEHEMSQSWSRRGRRSMAKAIIPRSRDRPWEHNASRAQAQYRRDSHMPSDDSHMPATEPMRPLVQNERASKFATELYTVSYLVFFSIFGTLARLGLQWLTFYPGAPVEFSVLWANFSGSLLMGFLSEDRQLFREEWGKPTSNWPEKVAKDDEEKALAAAKTAHAKVKKTIPLYIGLTTGFCGSFTSFSSFIRDVFLALSNNLTTPINHPYTGTAPSTSSTVHRDGGYSFMALVGIIIITLGVCMSALKIGAHLAFALNPYAPTFSYRFTRHLVDNLAVFLGWGCWVGAIFMSIWPPDRPGGPEARPGGWAAETWRGQAVFACVFAPLGCLMRFYASLKLNGIAPAFPLGTFAVNIFGTAVLGMAYDLQHVPLGRQANVAGGGRVGCQVLQGIMDGFCGSLTTVSTWVVELSTLRRGHGYVYGTVSVGVALGLLVVIMGSVRWTTGFSVPACVT